MVALTEEQRRAYALDLLNNPVLGDTLESMKADAFSAWKNTNTKDTEAREQAWWKYRAIEALESGIESVLAEANAENEPEDDSL